MKQGKKNKKLIIAFISLILFLLLTYTIFSHKIYSLDNNIASKVINIRNNHLTNIMLVITNISSVYALLAITTLLIFILKNKKKALLICYNLLLVAMTSQIAKIILRRSRPQDIQMINVDGFSYPSGHAMVSMAYFGFLAYLIYQKTKNKALKVVIIISLLIGAMAIGFSRVYLGVHYFSDIVGGFLLATVYLMIFINFNKLKLSGEDK